MTSLKNHKFYCFECGETMTLEDPTEGLNRLTCLACGADHQVKISLRAHVSKVFRPGKVEGLPGA